MGDRVSFRPPCFKYLFIPVLNAASEVRGDHGEWRPSAVVKKGSRPFVVGGSLFFRPGEYFAYHNGAEDEREARKQHPGELFAI